MAGENTDGCVQGIRILDHKSDIIGQMQYGAKLNQNVVPGGDIALCLVAGRPEAVRYQCCRRVHFDDSVLSNFCMRPCQRQRRSPVASELGQEGKRRVSSARYSVGSNIQRLLIQSALNLPIRFPAEHLVRLDRNRNSGPMRGKALP
jgi:hypothetical protein